MAPLSRLLGWHPDFAFSDLFDRDAVQVEAMEPCRPGGLFTLVHLRNAAPAVALGDRAVAAA